MALACRFLVFACVLTVLVGCETIPQHEALDTYPAYGPTGIRLGLNYGYNPGVDSGSFSTKYRVDDTSDLWKHTTGLAVEIPIDLNPYFGGYFGAGYEVMISDDFSTPTKNYNPDDLQLLPFYVGIMARYPFWLDKETWAEQVEPIWLPNKPIGPAVYAKLSGGGSALLNNSGINETDRTTGQKTGIRSLDRQIFPFVEGDIGVEYRNGRIGTWAEIGYRHYAIINRKLDGFDPKELGQLRAMIGVTFYLW